MTQAEVASVLGVSQKVVWNLMRRHDIPRRMASKRDQRAEKNSAWKGSQASYAALHLRVTAVRGKPSKCAACETSKAKRFEWANLSGRYEDVYDYVRLCASCHRRFDVVINNIRHMREGRS